MRVSIDDCRFLIKHCNEHDPWPPSRKQPREPCVSVLFADPDGFSLRVPSSWSASTGSAEALNANEQRRVLAWYPDASNAGRASVSVVITNVAADFTTLGSFGTPEAFAQTLVNNLDRSYTLRSSFGRSKVDPEGVQIAKLVDAGKRSGMYTLSYSLKRPYVAPTRLWEVVALGFDGTYNRLYTVTGQCQENELDKFKTEIEGILASFKPPAIASGLAM